MMIDEQMNIADSSAQCSSNTVVIGSGGEVKETKYGKEKRQVD